MEAIILRSKIKELLVKKEMQDLIAGPTAIHFWERF